MAKNKQDNKAAMDPDARETATPENRGNNPRNCWAIDTLIDEVLALFPETSVETSNRNGRNVALDVQFFLDNIDDQGTLLELLEQTHSDPRVDEVLYDYDDGTILVSFHNNARFQDSRDPFGLDEVYMVIIENAEEDSL